jgi:hypothetical protein
VAHGSAPFHFNVFLPRSEAQITSPCALSTAMHHTDSAKRQAVDRGEGIARLLRLPWLFLGQTDAKEVTYQGAGQHIG